MIALVLKYGTALAIPICGMTLIIHLFLIRRKAKIKSIDVAIRCVFVTYLCFLFVAVFIGRSRFSGISIVPFSSYYEAFQSSSLIGWRNIFLNIAMFIPFGFLLPKVFKRLQSVGAVVCSAVLTSLVVEIVQVITKRGVFEFDDIINNVIGAIIGVVILKCIYCKSGLKQ